MPLDLVGDLSRHGLGRSELCLVGFPPEPEAGGISSLGIIGLPTCGGFEMFHHVFHCISIRVAPWASISSISYTCWTWISNDNEWYRKNTWILHISMYDYIYIYIIASSSIFRHPMLFRRSSWSIAWVASAALWSWTSRGPTPQIWPPRGIRRPWRLNWRATAFLEQLLGYKKKWRFWCWFEMLQLDIFLKFRYWQIEFNTFPTEERVETGHWTGTEETSSMLETLKAERIPCKLSEMNGSVVDCTWKKLSAKVLPSLTVPWKKPSYGSGGNILFGHLDKWIWIIPIVTTSPQLKPLGKSTLVWSHLIPASGL